MRSFRKTYAGIVTLGMAIAVGVPSPALAAADSLLTWQDLSALKVYHAYSASDGRSYIEEMSIPASTKPSGGKLAQLYYTAQPSSVAIARSASGSVIDWHYAGEFRHFMVPLQGQLMFDTGDGKIFYLKVGEMLIDANPHTLPLRVPPKP